MYVCVSTAGTETTVAIGETLQVAAAANQTDEDATVEEQLLHTSLNGMIYHFLLHTVNIKRTGLIDKLVSNEILSRSEIQMMKKHKMTETRVKSLLAILREKSGAEFDRFLTTLGEEGHETVADVVRQALHTVRRTGQNPLQSGCGKTVYYLRQGGYVFFGVN